MINFIDIVVDLVNGDSGKKEVCYQLLKRKEYTHSMRVNGGSNSGGNVHFTDKEGNKKHIILHQIPSAILHGKKCIIGSGCVVNLEKLCNELYELHNLGIDVNDKLFIAENAHVVLDKHIEEEKNESSVGTTRQGIGPCYRDKYNRTGIRIKDIMNNLYVYSTMTDSDIFYDIQHKFTMFGVQIIDLYKYFYTTDEDINLLVELAQGFNLDIDMGDYPYVTSSNTTVAAALQNMLPWNKIRNVYGLAKAYDTYVGNKKFQPDLSIFSELQELGSELGATTKRKRQCNWLNVTALKKAADVNCITHLIISKIDIMEELNKKHHDKFWKIIYGPSDNKSTVVYADQEAFEKNVSNLFRGTKIQFRNAPDCHVN